VRWLVLLSLIPLACAPTRLSCDDESPCPGGLACSDDGVCVPEELPERPVFDAGAPPGPEDAGPPLVEDAGAPPGPEDAGAPPVEDAGEPVEDAGQPVVDAGPPDGDDDGVDDGDDNCPADANADQHDEDGDGVGDVCDNCPGDANPGQSNEAEVNAGNAADELGDVCDPRPAQPGDTLALFDGFGGNALDAGTWTVVSGSWSVEGDQLRAPQTGEKIALEARGLVDAPLVIVRRMRVFDPVAGQNNNAWVLSRAAGAEGYGCSLRIEDTGQPLVASWRQALNGPASTATIEYTVGNTVRVRTRVSADDVACNIAGVNLQFAEAAFATSGPLRLEQRRLASATDFIVAYRLGE
jgi:hypothetical protein